MAVRRAEEGPARRIDPGDGRPASVSRPYNGVRKFKEERSRFPFGFVEERVVYFG